MLSWNVLFEDFNKKEIVYYDIFKGGYFEEVARELKKKTGNKKVFTEKFRLKLMSQFWARSEYEVVVTSWPPYISKEELDKLKQEDVKYRTNVNLTVGRKIDIYEQLQMNWQQFIDYVWNNI